MPLYKRCMLMLAVILVLAGGFAIYDCYEAGQEIAIAENNKAGELAAGEAAVYVTGEVNRPGLVYVALDARVADAVSKCGGLTAIADMDKVNMAQTVTDGMQIRVPEKAVQVQAVGVVPSPSADKASTAKAVSSGGTDGSELININTADAAALDKLKGIGPAMAQRIIDYREENGSFQSIEDLQKVKGIGKAKFAKLKDQITI